MLGTPDQDQINIIGVVFEGVFEGRTLPISTKTVVMAMMTCRATKSRMANWMLLFFKPLRNGVVAGCIMEGLI